MFVPAGYEPAIDIHFWFVDIFNRKLSELRANMPPELRNSPEGLDAVDGELGGEKGGALCHKVLIEYLKCVMPQENKNLYMCLQDRTLAYAGSYIFERVEGQGAQSDLFFLNDEYRHVGVRELLGKIMRAMEANAASAEMGPNITGHVRALRVMEKTPYAPNVFIDKDDAIGGLAQAIANYLLPSSDQEAIDDFRARQKRALRGVFGDLAGAHLVLTEAGAAEARKLLTALLNTFFSNLKKRLAGIVASDQNIKERIIATVDEFLQSNRPVKKDDILDSLHRSRVGTYRELCKGWAAAASEPGREFMSKPGPKSKPPK